MSKKNKKRIKFDLIIGISVAVILLVFTPLIIVFNVSILTSSPFPPSKKIEYKLPSIILKSLSITFVSFISPTLFFHNTVSFVRQKLILTAEEC